LAGFLLAAVPGLGGPAAAPAARDMTTAEERANVVPSPLAPAGAENYTTDSGRPSGQQSGGGGSLAAGAADPDDGGTGQDPEATLGSRASPLVVLSGSFLIVGLGLFALRWTARRFGDG
jgi:hypothetical protein